MHLTGRNRSWAAAGLPVMVMTALLTGVRGPDTFSHTASSGEQTVRLVAVKPKPKKRGPLGRRTAIPRGVLAQLQYFTGADGCMTDELDICFESVEGTASAMMAPSVNRLDIVNAVPDEPLTVTATAPSGRVVRIWRLTSERTSETLIFRILPWDEVGKYRFAVSQQSRGMSTTVEVSRPAQPSLIALLRDRNARQFPKTSPRGTTFRVAMGGFPPRSRVPLRIYRWEGKDKFPTYLTSHPVTVDAIGAGIWELPTYSGDPAGRYAVTHEGVWNRPHSRFMGQAYLAFCLAC